jgi:tetratricopeptide (TPR) repeat protein/tRNA A-37 threonylcarbamoyl transferase component Bud32
MSRTYVAIEEALGRRVVIKVLAPELLAGLSVERFRREILLAAQLQHPHVVPVLSAGDAEGLPWFTMPFVDGESLRQRLAEGQVGIGEVVSILRDVARALAYAHRHGIVHRDIKPDNVLLSSGSATVTDFGIAKAISAARAEGENFGATLTQVGTSIGTPTYMSPEQALGDPKTDHRADLYAYGVMAYELLAGRPPFQADSSTKLVAAHLGEVPRDVAELRPDCPPLLAELVMRCLAKDADDRPQHAGDLVRVLDTITSSGATSSAPAILRGGQMKLGKAIGLWAAATAVVGLIAWAATDVIGLPDWVLPGSLGVMIAGLPVLLFTAYVQRTAHKVFTATPRRTTGSSPVAHGTMATIALKASPHLSWRRAWLGGAMAVGGFAILVLAFMVMRAMGVGPMGSLQGRGMLGAREVLVVADFRGPAADEALGPTVAEALRTDLGQSQAFNVLSRATLREILGLMERPAESLVQFELAREIATREGAKAVLDGEVVRLGQGYVISARLVSALEGTELATFRQEAANDDALLPALGRLSRSVRERAGESLRSIRASTELERVTTPSLAALRKYVEGSRLADEEGESDRGLSMLAEAVELDTAFAMAWRKIAVLLGNEGRERDRALGAIETAYRHRSRLTEMERLLTEGYYHTRGPSPDPDKALTAYEQVLLLDSTSTSALNNAAVVYGQKRDFVRSEGLYRQVIRLPRTFGGAFTNLIQVQIRNGRPPEALDSTAAAFHQRFPNSNDTWEADWYAAWGKGDLERADSISRAVSQQARTLRQQTRATGTLSSTAALRGRPREALALATRTSEATLRALQTPGARLGFSGDSAYYAALFSEDPEATRAFLARGEARVPLDELPSSERPWGFYARLAAVIRDPVLARRALEGYERDEAAMAADAEGRRAFHGAHLALAEERWDDAISLLHEADRRLSIYFRYAWVQIGRAHDLAGRPDSAIAYLQRYVDTPDPNPGEDGQWLARTHKRLGELYEAKGDTEKAIEHFARFVNLWRDAEPELQPQVQDVSQRLERLRAGRG